MLDTETTGLEAEQGHRIIEIGAVEVIDRRLTGRRFHRYLNPERDIDDAAIEVHGITAEFLIDKPRFQEVVDEFLDFVQGAELVIHNAGFDVAFLDQELTRLEPMPGRLREHCAVTDSLALARHKHPGQKNSLDALCRRYGVDNSQRELHGALLDAEILADVYLAMTGGQTALFDDEHDVRAVDRRSDPTPYSTGARRRLIVVRASPEERQRHEERLDALDDAIGAPCVWRRLEPVDRTRSEEVVDA